MKRVLGIDGGLAHLGWAVALLPQKTGHCPPEILDGGVIETVKRHEGTVAESHQIRALELHAQLARVFEVHAPDEICAEAFSPPRDSRNACMLAWSWGVLCALAAQHGVPIRAKSPRPLKKALTGDDCAKKPRMISAAQKLYPESRALFPERDDLHEHFADAIAAIHFFHGAKAA